MIDQPDQHRAQALRAPLAPVPRGPAGALADAVLALLPLGPRLDVLRRRPRPVPRRCPPLPLYATAGAMALSRPYLGVHYPSDVAAGALLGAGRGPAARVRIGIVGLPNAGKSSLFNALTRAGAAAANYPFTTVEPNVAVVARARRAPGAGGRDGRAPARWCSRRSPSTTSPAWSAAPPRARGSATASWPTSARPTRSSTSSAPTATTRWSHPEGRVDPASRRRDDRDRAPARRPRAGRAPARAGRAGGQGGSAGRGGRGRVARRAGRRAAGGPAGALGAAARGRAGRRAGAPLADGQAGALRGQRGRGRGARAAAGARRAGGRRGRRRGGA